MVLTILFLAIMLMLLLMKFIRTLQEARAAYGGYITFGGDDKYQNRNCQENIHDAAMLARIKFDMNDVEFDNIVKRIKINYTNWFNWLQNSISKKFREVGFCSHLEEWDNYRPYQLQDKQLLTQIIVCKQDKIIMLAGNHVFLGGYLLSQFIQLVFCDNYYNGIFPKNKYIPFVSELLVIRLFIQILLSKRHTPAAIYDKKTLIKRYYMKTNIHQLQLEAENSKINYAILIIAKHVMQVMHCLQKDRIRVSLPSSFEDTVTFNTVGTMFIELDKEPNLIIMAKKIQKLIRKNRYQVSVTNHIQRIFPTRYLSTRARNRVDLTLTIVPDKTVPNHRMGNRIHAYEFTMENITYPVYIMAFLFEKNIYSSFMINSPSFSMEKFLKSSDNIMPMDFSL